MKTDFDQGGKNREATKRKFIHAVGEIFMAEGMKGLKINRIARKAGMDKQLIYRYFKGRDGLVEAYIHEKDFWMKFSKEIGTNISPEGSLADFSVAVAAILNAQLEYFFREKEMQQLILSEISAKNDLMVSISNLREMLGEELFKIMEPQLKNVDVNLRASCALLVAGIYYMVLHAKNNGSTFCGIDINKPGDLDQVKQTINQIIHLLFLHTK